MDNIQGSSSSYRGVNQDDFDGSTLSRVSCTVKNLPWKKIGFAVAGLGIVLVTIGLLSQFHVIDHVGSLSAKTIQDIGYFGGASLVVTGAGIYVIAAGYHKSNQKKMEKALDSLDRTNVDHIDPTLFQSN